MAVQAEQRERIRQALDALPPKARAIIMLSDVEGLSYREIAEVLRCPIGTVMSRLHNARKRLKLALGSMLVLLAWLAMGLVTGPPPAEAQQVVRFGVRVLEAWNRSAAEPQVPGAHAPLPPLHSQGAPAPPSPGAPLVRSPAARPWVPDPNAQPTVPPVAGAVLPPPGGDSEERYKRLLPELQRIFRFSDFTPVARHVLEGPIGVMQRFPISGDRSLTVTPEKLRGRWVSMHVQLLKGEEPEMIASLRASPGAPAIFAGPAYGRGVLIIILWANPNPAGSLPRGVPERAA